MSARTSTRTRVLGVAIGVSATVGLLTGSWPVTLTTVALCAAYGWSQWEDAR